jgi:hypothetical protein
MCQLPQRNVSGGLSMFGFTIAGTAKTLRGRHARSSRQAPLAVLAAMAVLIMAGLGATVSKAAPVTPEEDVHCRDYATNSVAISKSIAAKFPECGLVAPWYSDDFDGHYAWCLAVGKDAASNEQSRKGSEAYSCQICTKAAQDVTAAARRMPSACSVDEVPYVPPGRIDDYASNFDECYFKAGDRYTANAVFIDAGGVFVNAVKACKLSKGGATGGATGGLQAKADCFSGIRVVEAGPGKGKQINAKFCLTWAAKPCKMTGSGIKSQTVSACDPGQSITTRVRYTSGASITWSLKRRSDGGLTGTWKHSDGATGFFAMP